LNEAYTKVYQINGLGQLVAVCAFTGATQQPNTQPYDCGQHFSGGLDIDGTGFLTTYAYDPLGNLKSATMEKIFEITVTGN